MMLANFHAFPRIPPDPIFGLQKRFIQDPRGHKVNLSVGVYKDSALQTPILTCVKEAEKQLLQQEETKNYLPIEGDPLFLQEVRKVLGTEELCAFQVLGGSGGLRLGAEMLYSLGERKIYVPKPTWLNHLGIFSQCGHQVFEYPYYDCMKKKVDFLAMKEFLHDLPPGSVFVVHVCCHNPTGADLSKREWEELSFLCAKNKLVPFFDAAYLGWDLGFEEDVFPLQLFIQERRDFLLTISFSKNCALYAERVGFFCLHGESLVIDHALSLGKQLIRRNYSNPPLHGARIVATILRTPFLRNLWKEELCCMRERIRYMRELFVQELIRHGKGDAGLLEKTGLFALLSLQKEQVENLIKQHAIYLTEDGRICFAGLTEEVIPTVVQAMCVL